MPDPEVDALRARVEELERRVEILFTNTGAIDMEETGADMATTMGAIGKLSS